MQKLSRAARRVLLFIDNQRSAVNADVLSSALGIDARPLGVILAELETAQLVEQHDKFKEAYSLTHAGRQWVKRARDRRAALLVALAAAVGVALIALAFVIGRVTVPAPPPAMAFRSVVYSVNDGPRIVLDLRSDSETGIDLRTGDTLTVHEVWYRSNASRNESFYVEGFLAEERGKFNNVYYQAINGGAIKSGVNRVNVEMHWEIPGDRSFLGLNLGWRDAVMDWLSVPLRAEGAPGLIPRAEAALKALGPVEYVDFESDADLNGWTGTDTSEALSRSADHAFTGESALAVTAGTQQGVFAHWYRAFQADLVIGQVYWPSQTGVTVSWAQVCLSGPWLCFPIPVRADEWNTFVLDLARESYQGALMSSVEYTELYIQGDVSAAGDAPYTFYVDGIQFYAAAPDAD